MLKMFESACGNNAMRRLSPLLLIPLAALAGCGGGGGGGDTGGPGLNPNSYTVTGVIQNANNVGVKGFAVLFDGKQSLSATSDAAGKFSIAMPPSAVTGTDHLNVYDPSGALAVIDDISPSKTATTFDAGTIVAGPPPPPGP